MPIISQQTGQFAGYKLGSGTTHLRNLTLRNLRVSDTSRYSSTGGSADYDWIDDALNRAQEEFVRKTLCLRTYAIVELKANYRTYRFPEDFLDLKAAYYYDASLTNGYRELVWRSIEEMDDDIDDYRTETGSGGPTHIYLDRIYGVNWMFGVYPIPTQDGNTITFDTDYGEVVQWVCPIHTFNQEHGVVLRQSATDEYFFNTDAGVVARVVSADRNIWLEYYRLPLELSNVGQYPEVPKEYQKALVYWTCWDLLNNNPEDSVETKRAQMFLQKFNEEVQDYMLRRNRPKKIHNPRAKAMAWSWLGGMDWHSKLP